MPNDHRDNFGLTDRDTKTIQDIFLKYPEVEQVTIFGSRAKGNYKLGSDIDLAIMNDNLDPKTLIRLAQDFDDSSLPYRVDVVNFATIKSPDLIQHIQRAGKAFFDREMATTIQMT